MEKRIILVSSWVSARRPTKARNFYFMQITISRSVLSEALMELAPLASKKTPLSILNNIKFVTKGNKIRMQPTDTETSIRKYVEAESIDQDGEFLVDCAILTAFVVKTKGETLTLTISDGQLTVKHGRGTASFMTLPNDEFVEPKQDDETTDVSIPASVLAEFIVAAKNFVGDDVLRPQIKPIRAIMKGWRVHCVRN
jgi:DNA polymerase III sliding clamp (beta) subunit (PCNA family)